MADAMISAVSAYQTAEAQKNMAQWQSDQAKVNAQASADQANAAADAREADAAQQEKLEREKNEKIKAQNRANAGVQGIDNSGSSLLYDISTAKQMELNALEIRRQGENDAAMIRWQGQMGAYNSLVSAEGYQYQADNAAAAQGLNTAAGAISGLGTDLSLTANGFSLYDKGKRKGWY